MELESSLSLMKREMEHVSILKLNIPLSGKTSECIQPPGPPRGQAVGTMLTMTVTRPCQHQPPGSSTQEKMGLALWPVRTRNLPFYCKFFEN